jgi:hypothetical protein
MSLDVYGHVIIDRAAGEWRDFCAAHVPPDALMVWSRCGLTGTKQAAIPLPESTHHVKKASVPWSRAP